MFSLVYTHAVVSWSDKNTFWPNLPIIFHIVFCYVCVANPFKELSTITVSFLSLPFTWNPHPVSPPLYPRNYTCRGQKWLLWSGSKVSWSLFLAHQLDLTWLTALPHTSLGIQNTKLSWFSSSSPAAPFFVFLPDFSLLPRFFFFFFSCWSAPRFSCCPLCFFYSPLTPGDLIQSHGLKKTSSERLLTPKFLSPTQTPFLNSKSLFPIIYSVSFSYMLHMPETKCLFFLFKMAVSPTNF